MEFSELDAFLSCHVGESMPWTDDTVLMEVVSDEGGAVVEVNIEYAREWDELYLYSPVGWSPDSELGEAGVMLLEANLFGNDTCGYAAFAYDDEEEAVVLWDRMKLAETTVDDFVARYYRFFKALSHWRATLFLGDEDEGAPELGASGAMIRG